MALAPETTRQRYRRERRTRFPGITADAAALGIRRTSLFAALAGKRPGCSLTKRYLALKAKQANQPTPTKQARMNAKLLAQNRQLLNELNAAKKIATDLQPHLPAEAGALPHMPEIAEIDKAIEVVTARIATLEANV